MAALDHSRRLPHGAPVVCAIDGLYRLAIKLRHPIAEQTRNDKTKRLCLGQTPLSGLIPALFFGRLVLRHTDDSLHLRADQTAHSLCGDQNCGDRHNRHDGEASGECPGVRARCDCAQKRKCRGEQAENCAHVETFHHAETDGQAGQDGSQYPVANRRTGQSSDRQQVHRPCQGPDSQSPTPC